MTNVIYYALMLVLFMTFSTGAMQYSGVNRTFLCLFRGLFEASVSFIDEEGDLGEVYFAKQALEKYVDDYFKDNLPRYVKSYTYSFLYYNQEDHSLCTNPKCSAVKISLKASINSLFEYEKAKDYYIIGGS